MDVYEELELIDGDDNNYLEHHGVLGMHWGIRRYQNADGSLTTAGRKRYSKRYDDGSERQDKLDEERREIKESKPKLSKEQKKKIAIAGAAAIGTTLAVYGGVKIAKARKEILDAGFDALERKIRQGAYSFEADNVIDMGPRTLSNLKKSTGLSAKDWRSNMTLAKNSGMNAKSAFYNIYNGQMRPLTAAEQLKYLGYNVK